MEQVKSSSAPAPVGPYSQAIKSNGFIFVSGQIAIDKSGKLVDKDINYQTKLIFKSIEAILMEAGSSLNKIVKVSVFLINIDYFKAANSVFAEIFKEPYPARETVEVACLPKNADIEISVIAES
jgi:2-iminobutanoate/2-iminopropanoate deaminase